MIAHRLLRSALAIAAALMAVPAGAAAAGWTPAQDLGEGGSSSGVRVAAAGAGDAVAAWTLTPDAGAPAVYAALHPGGAPAGAAQRLSGPEVDAGAAPSAAASTDGVLAVAWSTADAADRERIELAVGSASGGLTSRSTVQPAAAGADATDPAVAVAPGGRALVAWVAGSDPARVRAAIRAPDGALTVLGNLSNTGIASDIGVLAGPDGGFLVVLAKELVTSTGITTSIEQVRVSPSGATSPATLETATLVEDDATGVALGGELGRPVAAAGPDGRAIVAWERSVTTTPPGTPDDPDDDITATDVRAARGTAGGVSGAQTISGVSAEAGAPAVAVGDGGRVAASFVDGAAVSVAVADGDGPLGAPEPVGAGDEPAVAVTPAGEVAVAFNPAADGLSGRIRAGDGAFGPETPLDGAPAGPAALDADAEGNVAAGYASTTTSTGVARLLAYDAAPPRIVPSIPSSAVTGSPVPFSVVATDSWSATGVSWDFGDGRTSTQTAPRIPYSAAGDYDVSLAVTDAVGNRSSARGTVRVRDRAGAPTTPAAPTPAAATPAAGDASAPVLSALRALRTLFRVAGRGHGPLKAGSGFRFVLSEPATVSISVFRLAYAPRLRSRCLVSGPLPRGPRPRVGLAKRWRVPASAGVNVLPFKGLAGGRRLVRGRYVARFVAGDARGNRSPVATVSFTIC